MSKEIFIACHEELTVEYMVAHPEVDWEEAYDATADAALLRMTDRLADMADNYRDRMKDGQ